MYRHVSYWPVIFLFVSVLGHLMFWSFFGIDLTDSGFYLVQQAEIARGGLERFMSVTWLSNQLGSLWLQLPFGDYLLWARFGSALALSTAATFSFATWRRFCDPGEHWYIWGVVFLIAALPDNVQVLNHYSLSVAVLATALFLFTRIMRGESRWVGIEAVLLGSLIGLLPFLRLPLLPMLCMPFVAVAYARLMKHRYPVRFRVASFAIRVCVGIGISFGVVLLFLSIQGVLGVYYEGIESRVLIRFLQSSPVYKGYRYTFVGQLGIWAKEVLRLASAVLIVFGCMQIVRVTSLRRILKRLGIPYAVLVILLLVVLLTIMFRLGIFRGAVLYGTLALILPLSLALVFSRTIAQEGPLGFGEGLLFAVCGMFLLVIGSDGPLPRLFYGAVMVVPAIALLQCTTGMLQHIKLRNALLRGLFDVTRQVPKMLVLVVLVVLVFFMEVCPWRDSCMWHLNSALQYPSCSFILTTSNRQTVVDEVLREVSSRVRPGSTILCVGRIPIVYYLTGTRPFIEYPWPSLLSADELSRVLAREWTIASYPQLVVMAKKSTAARNWPDTEEVYIETGPTLKLLMEYLERYRYVMVWENAGFCIYGLDTLCGTR